MQPKNLLFILSDNHNRRLAGCYGHPQATTPALDRLAAKGARFTTAYSASPLCCPARAALATGRFPHQTGYWDNAIVYDGKVPSWMHRLRDQGHEVTSIGKLHFRSDDDDNGFSEELLPMHILNGKGGVHMLLRGHAAEQINHGQWELYMERSGVGTAPYQAFDREITETAITWLKDHRKRSEKPWALFVSYPSPHPPFAVPEDFYRLHDENAVTLPLNHDPEGRSHHPAIEHLRHIMGTGELTDEAALRKVTAGYLGLIAHLDHQIGRLLACLEDEGLQGDTRILYTSDHGDLYGEHGLFGKCCMYEGSIGVPLIIAGPEIEAGRTIDRITSHTDLFPTIVEGLGAELLPEDDDLPGQSLWPAIHGKDDNRPGFAEYHAAGSKTGMFMLRDGALKLVHYVGMPSQLFALDHDPDEVNDLVQNGAAGDELARMEAALLAICDPVDVDARAKADQRAKIDFWGGREAVEREGLLVYTPPPGRTAEIVVGDEQS